MTNPTSERTMTNKPRTRNYTVEAYHRGFGVRVVTKVRVTDSYLIPGAVFVSGDGVLIPASTVTTLGGCSADVVGSDSEAVTAHASAYNCSVESMSPVIDDCQKDALDSLFALSDERIAFLASIVCPDAPMEGYSGRPLAHVLDATLVPGVDGEQAIRNLLALLG